jgi:glycosyltransferase involved in cell wall biosynthesis
MNIAIFWEQPSWGGVDEHIVTLLKNWNEKSDNITLFSNEDNQGLARIKHRLMKLDTVSVVTYNPIFTNTKDRKTKRKLRIVFTPILFLHSLIKFYKLFKKYGHFDALISENGGYPGAWGCLSAIISAKIQKIPKRMLVIHHPSVRERFYLYYFEKLIDFMISKLVTDFVAVSLATRKSLYIKRGFQTSSTTIRVVYNGIDAIEGKKTNNILDIREHYSIKESILIGIVGRVERYKGHEDLIYGYSLLNKENQKKIKIIFIGSGTEAEITRLKNISKTLDVENSIIYTGFLKGDSKKLIGQLDILMVLTKDTEGFGLTIGEAMKVEVPVIVTRVGAIPEFVSDDVGCLLPPESPYAVCEALNNYLENPNEFYNRAKKAKDYINKFSAQRMVNHIKVLMLM